MLLRKITKAESEVTNRTNTQNADVSKIPDERLTNTLYERGQAKAALERDWIIAEHSRHVVLSEVSALYGKDSLAEANRKARVSQEYKDHIQKMGDIKGNLIIARAQYEAVAFEIKMRLAKQFEDRQEFKSGNLSA